MGLRGRPDCAVVVQSAFSQTAGENVHVSVSILNSTNKIRFVKIIIAAQ